MAIGARTPTSCAGTMSSASKNTRARRSNISRRMGWTAALAALEIGRRVPDQAEWLKLYPEAGCRRSGSTARHAGEALPPGCSCGGGHPVAAPGRSTRRLPPPTNRPKAHAGRGASSSPSSAARWRCCCSCSWCAVAPPAAARPRPATLRVTATATLLPETPPAGEPSVTATVDTPVRSGPGDLYPAVGSLLAGQTVEVVGKSADLQWWAIRFIAAPGRVGWLRADQVTAANTDAVPIMQAPPLPTATATPAPTLTAIADRHAIADGGSGPRRRHQWPHRGQSRRPPAIQRPALHRRAGKQHRRLRLGLRRRFDRERGRGDQSLRAPRHL